MRLVSVFFAVVSPIVGVYSSYENCGGVIAAKLEALGRGDAELLVDQSVPYYPGGIDPDPTSIDTSMKRTRAPYNLYLVEKILSGVTDPWSISWKDFQLLSNEDHSNMMRGIGEKFSSQTENPYLVCRVKEKVRKGNTENDISDHTFLIQKESANKFRLWQSSVHDYSLYDWLKEQKIKRKYYYYPKWVPENRLNNESPIYKKEMNIEQLRDFLTKFGEFSNPRLRAESNERLTYSRIDDLRTKLFWTRPVKYSNVPAELKFWKVLWNDETVSAVYEVPDINNSPQKVAIGDNDDVPISVQCRVGEIIDRCAENARKVLDAVPYNGWSWYDVYNSEKGWNNFKSLSQIAQLRRTISQEDLERRWQEAQY